MPCFSTLLDNANKIENIFGKDFLKKSIEDRLDIKDSLMANDYLANLLYGSEIASLLKKHNLKRIEELYRELYEEFILSNEKIENTNLDKIGLLILRPETLKNEDIYISFLTKLQFDIILQKRIVLDFKKYWLLYHHGLINRDTKYEFPTRTFNYIFNECLLLVVKKANVNFSNNSVSTILTRHKGREGMYIPETFRGIAFDLLKDYVIDTNKFSEQANVALDPIGMYRLITRSLVESDRRHEKVNIPLLLFAGQAVHIPNDEEIAKDLTVICEKEDIELIKRKI